MAHIQDAGRAGQTPSPLRGCLVKHSFRRSRLVMPWSDCRDPSLRGNSLGLFVKERLFPCPPSLSITGVSRAMECRDARMFHFHVARALAHMYELSGEHKTTFTQMSCCFSQRGRAYVSRGEHTHRNAYTYITHMHTRTLTLSHIWKWNGMEKNSFQSQINCYSSPRTDKQTHIKGYEQAFTHTPIQTICYSFQPAHQT